MAQDRQGTSSMPHTRPQVYTCGSHAHRRGRADVQTPPTPALRLCIIKPIGFAGLFRECNPCFSGHYRLFALKKANLLNDALVARMSWRGLSRAVPPRRGATCTRPRPPARAAAESSGPDGSSLSAQTQHLNHEPPTACNTLLSKELQHSDLPGHRAHLRGVS